MIRTFWWGLGQNVFRVWSKFLWVMPFLSVPGPDLLSGPLLLEACTSLEFISFKQFICYFEKLLSSLKLRAFQEWFHFLPLWNVSLDDSGTFIAWTSAAFWGLASSSLGNLKSLTAFAERLDFLTVTPN